MTKLIIVLLVFLVALILITMHFQLKDELTFMRMVIGDACLAGFVTGLIVSNIVIG